MVKVFLRLFAVIMIAALLFSCTKKKEDDAGLPGPNVGSPAPLFTLKDIDGKEISLMDFDGKVVKDYQVMGVPTTYFIDRDGIIRDRIFGGMNELVIEAKLEDLLKNA